MKKAKMMLLAIAVVGIAGGAMAFNAQRGTSVAYSGCTTGLVPNVCTATKSAIQNAVTTDASHGTAVSGILGTGNVNITCTADSDCGTFYTAFNF